MKKRFVALAMMAVLTVGMIAGCGNGDGGSGDSGNTDAGNNTDAGSQTQQTPERRRIMQGLARATRRTLPARVRRSRSGRGTRRLTATRWRRPRRFTATA